MFQKLAWQSYTRNLKKAGLHAPLDHVLEMPCADVLYISRPRAVFDNLMYKAPVEVEVGSRVHEEAVVPIGPAPESRGCPEMIGHQIVQEAEHGLCPESGAPSISYNTI